MDPILKTTGLVKAFGGLVAVDHVDMEVRRNTITLLIGPNGSGKTTLINVVTGIYPADGGRIIFEGRDVTGLPPHARARLGMSRTFQNPRLFPRLTVLENMLVSAYRNVGIDVLRRWVKEERELVRRAFAILRALRLDEHWHKWASDLSGGQMKLLEIGRALMAGARLIIMDEPLAGVHPSLAHEILGRLKETVGRADVTFLLVEHRLDIALEYADYAYAMAFGRIISQGDPRKVVSEPIVVESYLGRPIA